MVKSVRKSLIVAAPVMMAILAPSVTWATGLTGLWLGSFSCEVLINGEPSRLRTSAELAITEDPATGVIGARVIEEGNPAPFFFSGIAAGNLRGSRGGAATFILCDTNPRDPLAFNEVITARYNGNPRDSKLTGTGVFSWGRAAAVGGECSFEYRRVSHEDPGIGLCPVR